MEQVRLANDILARRVRAFRLIKERSFRRGKIVLSSGRESDYYLDLKPTMLHPEGIEVLCELIYDRVTALPAVHYVGGLEIGAVPLLSPFSLTAFMKGRHIPGFFVRKKVKSHGTRKLIEGVAEGELQGKSVVILDDVTTLGSSAMQAVDAAEAAGARVELVLSIVDREEGAAALFDAKGIAFDALFRANEFLEAAE
jgi:orotate phosphoribosyltransferase